MCIVQILQTIPVTSASTVVYGCKVVFANLFDLQTHNTHYGCLVTLCWQRNKKEVHNPSFLLSLITTFLLCQCLNNMDSKTADVIARAIAEKEKTEKGLEAPLETKHSRHGTNKETKSLSKSSHKEFAVDPELNVGVGIISGITGPKAIREVFESAQAALLDRDSCSRCKKTFPADLTGKVYKLCPHCRELQRERSRRWQQKTKLKEGACRRCGVQIPEEHSRYVLCPPCRLGLRTRKASRFENGKCVHCSGINDCTDYKVCTRCRTNDKQRRKMLEQRGCCNRCAKELSDSERSNKVCINCRSKKKIKTGDEVESDVEGDNTTGEQNNRAEVNVDLDANAAVQMAAEDAANETYQQVAQQLEANLFAHEGNEADASAESIQALAHATTSSNH